MKKNLIIVLPLLLLTIGSAQAAGLVPCGGHGEPDCTFCHLFVMINNIVQFIIFRLVPVVAVLMLVIGGTIFFFAGAKPDLLMHAKGIITSTIIGLVIVFSAWVIVNTILTKLGIIDTPSILEWYNINCPIQ